MIQLLPHHFLLFQLFRVTDKQEMRWAAGLFPELIMYQVLRGNFKKTKIKTKYISPKHFKRRFLSFVWGWTALILHSFQCMWGCRLLFLNPAKNTLSSQGTEVYSTAVDLQTTSIPLFFGGGCSSLQSLPQLNWPLSPSFLLAGVKTVHHCQHTLLSCSKQDLGRRCKSVLSSWELSPGAVFLTRDKYSSEHRVKCQKQKI